MTYTPASVVVVLDATLVSTFVAITVAPTSTPPAESVTVPLNCDRATCACATLPHSRNAATTNDRQAVVVMMSAPPTERLYCFGAGLSTETPRTKTLDLFGAPHQPPD